jgi:ethanolamine utilization protein EutQ (cupin superfamily)
VGPIFQVNENDLPWAEYGGGNGGPTEVRFKALTSNAEGVPPMQYIEYASGHTDPVHSHDSGEVMIVIAGELSLGDVTSGPGGVVFVPGGTEYAVRSGSEGVRFFRVVVPNYEGRTARRSVAQHD